MTGKASGKNCEMGVAEVAKLLGIGERAVLYQVKEGKLKGRKVGRRWYIELPDEMMQIEKTDQEVPAARNNDRRSEERDRSRGDDDRSSYRASLQRKGDFSKSRRNFTELAAYKGLLEWRRHPGITADEERLQRIDTVLDNLAIGFYKWNKALKINWYDQARDKMACLLSYHVAHPVTDKKLQDEFFKNLHHELMGSLVALIKTIERQNERRGPQDAN